jgi:hypothetical protein
MRNLRSIVGAMVLLFPSILTSQSKPSASATEMARRFFAAWADGRWLEAARMLDLSAFESYRQDVIRSSRSGKSVVGPTPEQVMAQQPDMPRPVAEYIAGKYSAAADSDALSMLFARTTSADALAALPLEQAAARWLEARDPRWQAERSIAHLGPGCVRPRLDDIKKPPPNQALGEVNYRLTEPGGPDSLSYVVYRDPSVPRIPNQMPPGVLTLIPVKGVWKIVPLPDIGFPGGVNRYTTYGCVKVGVQRPN